MPSQTFRVLMVAAAVLSSTGVSLYYRGQLVRAQAETAAIAEDAKKERDQARADAVATARAADGLRKQAAALIEHSRYPAAASGSTATRDALDLLADVLGQLDKRAGELAAYADAARIAGQQCERSYDALMRERGN
ncbi:hypothetical protein DFQ28_003969 [Apophysomyces sp. BC1034]|nr:hypothetical protein DFQ28_003969 [Apophysomyces sp. BC1034]